jgi:pimeloyl-ACP methyl ester carboxylesterase
MSSESIVVSADGTQIAFDRSGSGPPLLLVEPAGHFRGFSAFEGLVPLLAEAFTVYRYDRRGRGASGDTQPYAPEREVEDLAALIAEAGDVANIYGYSSGALLALHAAAHNAAIERMVLVEPPLQEDDAARPDPLTGELAGLVAAGKNDDAVERFHRAIGVPDEIVDGMRDTPAFEAMAGIAPTLVYDCMLSDATPPQMLGSVNVPTLVLDSEGSTDDLTGWAARVASRLPNGSHRSLPGEWHGIPDEILAPVVIRFLGGTGERPQSGLNPR